jgi:hypothetical protein
MRPLNVGAVHYTRTMGTMATIGTMGTIGSMGTIESVRNNRNNGSNRNIRSNLSTSCGRHMYSSVTSTISTHTIWVLWYTGTHSTSIPQWNFIQSMHELIFCACSFDMSAALKLVFRPMHQLIMYACSLAVGVTLKLIMHACSFCMSGCALVLDLHEFRRPGNYSNDASIDHVCVRIWYERNVQVIQVCVLIRCECRIQHSYSTRASGHYVCMLIPHERRFGVSYLRMQYIDQLCMCAHST